MPPTGKTELTPRDSILLLATFPVPLDQRFAIDPCLAFRPFRLESADSDLARAPDAAPTGQTSETAKERVSLYAFQFLSQGSELLFISCIFNRVQPVHTLLPKNGAARFGPTSEIRRGRVLARSRACRQAAVHVALHGGRRGKCGENRMESEDRLI